MAEMNSMRQKPPIAADQTMYTERGPLRLPMDLRQWIPEEKLVEWINETVAANVHKEPSGPTETPQAAVTGRGKALLSVIVLGCTTGIFTSEDIARACQSEKAFASLCVGEAPFRQELEQFRRNHRAILEHVLTAVLLQAVKERYSKLEKLPPGMEYAVRCRAVDRLDTARHMDTWDE